MKSKAFFLLIFLSAGLYAQEREPRYGDEKAIIEAKKKAVVKIETIFKNGDLYTGSGTYIGNETIVTNFHVIEPYLKNQVKEIRVLDWRGGAATKISVGECGGADEKTDLCLVKVEGLDLHHPFKLMSKVFKSNYKIKGYGYCSEGGPLRSFSGPILDYTEALSEKLGADGTKFDHGASGYQIGISNCHGSSGGPIFDPVSGELIAVFTRYYFKESDNIKTHEDLKRKAKFAALSSIEIKQFVMNSGSYREIASEKINSQRKLASPYDIFTP